MNDADIRLVADRVLRKELGKFGYQRTEVRTGFDHSDEPAVYVDAVLGVGAPPLEPTTFFDTHAALGRALLAEGEQRFPYFRTRRLGDELPEDEPPREAPPRPDRSHS
jgi:hypothetical protein